jgi:serine/threonine-protein kinase
MSQARSVGKQDPPLDQAARAKLRAQGLDWLKAELATWAKLRESEPRSRSQIQQTLSHWQRDPDLAGVRDEAELAKLPAAEREAWRKLWSEVAELLAAKR